MVISDSSSVEKLAESVLMQIWHSSDGDRIELYPLNEHQNRQLLPGIDRSHLYGLFYNLHLIKVKGSDTILQESLHWDTQFPDFEKRRFEDANGKRIHKLILSGCSQVRQWKLTQS
jgi:hypothetical protein